MPSSPEPLLPGKIEILKNFFKLSPDFEAKKEIPGTSLINMDFHSDNLGINFLQF
jgi:hypothetical protein